MNFILLNFKIKYYIFIINLLYLILNIIYLEENSYIY